jgi:hypothetical protein
VCLAPLLSACGADDLELNGKIFDVMGMSGPQTKGKEPKLAARSPLVVPPSLERLPEPGSEAAAAPSDIAQIKDPDEQKKLDKSELERQQAEYCKVHYEQAMAHGDETEANLATGPLGPCKPSVLTAIQKWNKGDDEE